MAVGRTRAGTEVQRSIGDLYFMCQVKLKSISTRVYPSSCYHKVISTSG